MSGDDFKSVVNRLGSSDEGKDGGIVLSDVVFAARHDVPFIILTQFYLSVVFKTRSDIFYCPKVASAFVKKFH